MAADILIVDDEADIRELVAGILQDEGHRTRLARDSDEAFKAIEERRPQLVILDIWLQGSRLDGLEVLSAIKGAHPDLPVVIISGHGNIETAVTAIKRGAYDYIEKPFKADRLILVTLRALEASQLKREVKELRERSTVSAEMPIETQGKVLRVLVEQKFQRIGGAQKVAVDVRIISSTSRDLDREMEEGRFRQDLYHRLNVVPLRVPSLAERRDDIPELIEYFIAQLPWFWVPSLPHLTAIFSPSAP